MKFRDVQQQLNAEIHRATALEDLIGYLARASIPSPIEDGLVPDEVKAQLIRELQSRMQISELRIGELEEVDVDLPDPGNLVVLDHPR